MMNNSTNSSGEVTPGGTGELTLFAKITMAFQAITMVVIIAGNLLVLVAVIRFRALRDVTGIFVANLAVADLIVGFFTPYQMIFFLYPELEHDKYLCLLRYNIIVFSCNASIFSLACTVTDRYLAITYPMAYARLMTDKVAYISVIIIWSVDFVTAFIPMFGANNWDILPMCLYETVINKYYRMWCSLIGYVFALFMFVLYGRIFLIVQKHVRQIESENSAGSANDVTLRRKRQMTKVVAIVVLFFQISWLPFFSAQLTMLEFQDVTKEKVIVANFLVFLGILNSMVNPVIYAWKNKQYRRAFKKLLHLKVDEDLQTSVVSTLT